MVKLVNDFTSDKKTNNFKIYTKTILNFLTHLKKLKN